MKPEHDYVHHARWYTVYDAKTDEIVASGTSAQCARALGYKTTNSFVSGVCNTNKCGVHKKYRFFVERISRDEIDTQKSPSVREHRRACKG